MIYIYRYMFKMIIKKIKLSLSPFLSLLCTKKIIVIFFAAPPPSLCCFPFCHMPPSLSLTTPPLPSLLLSHARDGETLHHNTSLSPLLFLSIFISSSLFSVTTFFLHSSLSSLSLFPKNSLIMKEFSLPHSSSSQYPLSLVLAHTCIDA